ncbi:endonuclease/exonuclease/phosphatase family protein [Streptomyces olivoreticuli]|uniref:RICIN domain-containing protein n=1 Tax=Streptomyces olivoreticuli TaxID=68246 RepID=UPI000E2708A7|nr:endonuclease/exonuclease/phosphatase family protein [Streptomyces olivoreticuli]
MWLALIGIIGIMITVPTSANAFQPNERGIATWNSQGGNKWNTVRDLSNQNDLVAIQEAGQDPEHMVDMRFEGQFYVNGYYVNRYAWGNRFVYWMRTSPTTDSAQMNLAFVTHERADQVIVAPSGADRTRPALGLRFGDDIYYNVHAQASGERNEVGALLNSIHGVSAGRQWTALGDFNREPNQQVHDWATSLGAYVYHSGSVTQHSQNELDYMISSRSMQNYRGEVHGDGLSDHYPIYFRTHLAANGATVSLSNDKRERFAQPEKGSSANGTRIVTGEYGGKGSTWRLQHAANGGQWDFKFINTTTGKCMDVSKGIYSQQGDFIDEYDCMDIPNQVFTIYSSTAEPGSWQIVNKYTNLTVDAMGDTPEYLGLWQGNGGLNQRFMPIFSS